MPRQLENRFRLDFVIPGLCCFFSTGNAINPFQITCLTIRCVPMPVVLTSGMPSLHLIQQELFPPKVQRNRIRFEWKNQIKPN